MKKAIVFTLIFALCFNPLFVRALHANAATDDSEKQAVSFALTAGAVIGVTILIVKLIQHSRAKKKQAADAKLLAEQQAKEIWPMPGSAWVFHTPKVVPTSDEAIANIKNIQNRMMLEGMQPSELDVDKYGMRVKLKWVVTEKGENVASTYGGFWLGWNYVPTNTTTSQPWTKETPKEKMVIIPFKDFTGTSLTNFNNTITVTVFVGSGETIAVNTKDMNAAYDLIDSLYTLHDALVGVTGADYKRLGIMFVDLTQAEKEALGIKYGALVKSVGAGSPGEAAGIRYPDIITEVNGEMVDGADQCVDKIFKSGPVVKVRIIRWADDAAIALGIKDSSSHGVSTDGGKTTTYSFADWDSRVRGKGAMVNIEFNKDKIKTSEGTVTKK
jgi:hypothetical protein